MPSAIKRIVRPVALPLLHGWQYISNVVRHPWYLKKQAEEGQKALEDAVPILEDVNGFRFALYPYDQPHLMELLARKADAGDFQAIPRLVHPGDIAFDVGAHAGVYSALLSRLCGPNGRVWSFEPVPETYWRLRENLALNRCDSVFPVQAAVCEKNGSATINLFGARHSEWNGLGRPTMRVSEDSRVSPCASIEVRACTLDAFCSAERIDRVNFLKVDVEGFELSVFCGAEALLTARRIDYICFEISQQPLKGAGVESRRVFEKLTVYGYHSYRLDRTTGRFEGPILDTSEDWENFYASAIDLTALNPGGAV